MLLYDNVQHKNVSRKTTAFHRCLHRLVFAVCKGEYAGSYHRGTCVLHLMDSHRNLHCDKFSDRDGVHSSDACHMPVSV